MYYASNATWPAWIPGIDSPAAGGHVVQVAYRGTSLIRDSAPLGPYSRTVPRALRWSQGGGQFLMSEVPL